MAKKRTYKKTRSIYVNKLRMDPKLFEKYFGRKK